MALKYLDEDTRVNEGVVAYFVRDVVEWMLFGERNG